MSKSVEEVRRAAFEKAWAASGLEKFKETAWWAFNAALDAVEIQFPEIPKWRDASDIRGSQLRPDLLLKEGEEHGIRQCRAAIEQTGLGLRVK